MGHPVRQVKHNLYKPVHHFDTEVKVVINKFKKYIFNIVNIHGLSEVCPLLNFCLFPSANIGFRNLLWETIAIVDICVDRKSERNI
jgi:hypothetical protein